jgi:hypothetical protein
MLKEQIIFDSCEIALVKSSKNQRLRDKVRTEVRYTKQTLLGSQAEGGKAKPTNAALPERKKQIEITDFCTSTREDELVLKVGFKLLPSRAAFSRVTSDLFFDGEKIESLRLRVLQGPLATDAAEFSSVLDMAGIGEGQHTLRVEMFELWGSKEKLTCTTKEVAVEYVPLRREDRLMRVPILKSVAGTDLAIVSDTEKKIHRELEEEMKKEATSRRDQW